MMDETAYLDYIQKNAAFLQHEDQLVKQPFDVGAWNLYLDTVDECILAPSKDDGENSNIVPLLWRIRDWLGRRAVAALPRSYKLWKNHWEFVVRGHKKSIFDDTEIIACFERSLWTLSAHPRVWLDYLTFLKDHPACTTIAVVRRTVNRSLQSLPVTQHGKIWPVVLDWIHGEEKATNANNNDNVDAVDIMALPFWQIPQETSVRLLRRYCLYNPSYHREFAEFLMTQERWGEAAVAYQHLLNSVSGSGSMQRDDYWQTFAQLCSQHPVQVEQAGVPWEDIVRAVLQDTQTASAKQQDASGVSDASTLLEGILWTQLADSWIRRGSFELARSVYEEGLQKVKTVRDFSILYDAYLQFEEGLFEAATNSMEDLDMDDENESSEKTPDDDWDILLEETASSKLAEMELAMSRAEHLTSRRPLMLNAVMLRQNPNNVGEWVQRAELYVNLEQDGQASSALEEALRTVVAGKAINGSPSQLVVKLAQLYEKSDVGKARDLFDRICKQHVYQFRNVDDLAQCWATWVELELRHEAWDEVLSVARQAVAPGSGTRRLNLTKSLRLWDLLLDLEESLGTVQTTKDAYNGVLSIKAATAQHVLNFAAYLTEQKYFEEAFSAYERGIELFAFPHPGAKLLWKSYLKSFSDRYVGTKVGRTRDLFQRCLEHCPPEDSAEFFILNGEFEESYGLTKRALSVYRAMCQTVPDSEKYSAYELFIAKTTKYLGLTATRDIYQEAVEKLTHQDSAKMCLEFAKMETSLQEIERARAILTYGSQMADPRRLTEYWKTWNEFEIAHGNEESFREMLRVKRSVEAAFSTVNYNASGLNEKQQNLSDDQAMQMIASQEGVDDAPTKSNVSGFVPSTKRQAAGAGLSDVEARVAKLRKAAGAGGSPKDHDQRSNDDEIDIDDIDAEIEAAAAEGAGQ